MVFDNALISAGARTLRHGSAVALNAACPKTMTPSPSFAQSRREMRLWFAPDRKTHDVLPEFSDTNVIKPIPEQRARLIQPPPNTGLAENFANSQSRPGERRAADALHLGCPTTQPRRADSGNKMETSQPLWLVSSERPQNDGPACHNRVMAKKPQNVAWIGFTQEQGKDLDFLDFLGNNGWARNSQTDAIMTNVLARMINGGLTFEQITTAMTSIGYEPHAIRQLERWERKRTTGRFDPLRPGAANRPSAAGRPSARTWHSRDWFGED